MRLPHDKFDHFLIGITIGLVVALWMPAAFALVAAGLAGIAKEVWDHFHPGHVVEAADAAWTFGGGTVAFVLLTIREVTGSIF